MSYLHGILWLDHRHATVHALSTTGDHEITADSDWSARELHEHLADSRPGRPVDDHDFFDEIAASLEDIGEIVITGPGTSKTAFATYLADRYPGISEHVVGVETLDHPTGPQLVAYAKRYFHAVDQLGLAGEAARR